MEIKVQSIKFDADQKLLDFTDKKLSKLERFFEGITAVDVTMSLLNEAQNKDVKVVVYIPGSTVVVERSAKTFEDAVTEAADILKEKLTRIKEKRAE
ncbi:MAG: ribosome-associated translation inhibitor RaiA [Bacteroidales bacterium]|nr:ribosome-associated translation inhibitor RaiA [Bacteroidales bacterium]